MSLIKKNVRSFRIILSVLCTIIGVATASMLLLSSANASQIDTITLKSAASPSVIQAPSISYSNTVVIEDKGGDAGWGISSATINGRLAVAYFSSAKQALMYSRATDVDGTDWSTPIIIATGEYVSYISLNVINGKPAVSFSMSLPNTNSDLYFVIATDANGETWTNPIIAHDDTGNIGFYSSLAEVDGHPAISYYDSTSRDLMYIRATNANGSSWGAPITVQSTGTVGSYSSLALVNGKPAISYYDQTANRAKYIQASDGTGSSWNNAPVTVSTANNSGAYTDLAVIDGNPAIAYFNFVSRELIYVRASDADGTIWNGPVIAQSGLSNQSVSLSLIELNSKPAIAYGSRGNDINLSTSSDAAGSNWTVTKAVDGLVADTNNVTISIVNGKPAVTYYDGRGKGMSVHATNTTGTSWSDEVRIDGGIVGASLSSTLINGLLSIAYLDEGDSAIKYVQALDSEGNNWSSPSIVLTRTNDGYDALYLAEISGNPAITYYDDLGNLKYVRSTNATGTSWGTAVDVDPNAITSGGNLVLKMVNGKPAIAYENEEEINGQYFNYPMFIQATDALGSSWGTPVQLDSTGNYEGESDLEIANGVPALAYKVSSGIKYVQASDANGQTAWKSPVNAGLHQDQGHSPSLAIVNGYPAIAYIEQSTGSIRFARSTDIDGSGWASPVTFASTSDTPSLATIDGRPVISYWNAEGQAYDLNFIQANDLNGTSWDTPVVLDNDGDVGILHDFHAFGDYDGGIAYYDRDKGRLKFIYIRYDKYELNTQVAGNGNGTVTKSPDQTLYDPGSTVNLSTIAAVGSTFTGWSGGGCTGVGSCQITMAETTTVTATFILNQYPLSVATDGNGSGTVSQAPSATSYDFGTMVTLTAAANAGSTFSGWSGETCVGDGCSSNSCTGTTLSCTVTIDEAKSITATFTLLKYELATTTSGTGSGSIIRSPTGAEYDYGTVVTLTASAATGSTFIGWSGAGCSGTDSCTITITEEKSVNAAFIDDAIGYQIFMPIVRYDLHTDPPNTQGDR